MSTRNHMEEAKQSFEGGATRSAKPERFDLIPPEAELVRAKRFGLGSRKHGEGNWKHGGAQFIKAVICHTKSHMNSLLINGLEHDDDDIGAMGCNIDMLAWFREHKREEFAQALKELSEGKVEKPQ